MSRIAELILLQIHSDSKVGLSFGEAHNKEDVQALLSAFGVTAAGLEAAAKTVGAAPAVDAAFKRTSPYMSHPVFNTHRSETQASICVC